MSNKTHHRKGNEEVVIVIGGDQSGNASGSLAKTIQENLQNLGVEVSAEMQSVFDEVGKEAVQMLRETSPVNPKGKHSGRYAKGWRYEKGKRTQNYKCSGVIRNATDPQLTHLLEYGHPIVKNGKVAGNAEPKPHIRKVADYVAETLDQKLINKLGG